MKNTVFLNNLKTFLAGTLALLYAFKLSAQAGSESYSTLYNEAVRQIEQKNYPEARILLDKALQLKQDYAEAVFARGTCSLMLKEWDKACIDFEQAAKLSWEPSFEYLTKYCGKNSHGRKVNRTKK